MKVKSLSCVRLLAIPWTAAYQAPPSMGFSRQEYWSGVPLPSPNVRVIVSSYYSQNKIALSLDPQAQLVLAPCLFSSLCLLACSLCFRLTGLLLFPEILTSVLCLCWLQAAVPALFFAPLILSHRPDLKLKYHFFEEALPELISPSISSNRFVNHGPTFLCWKELLDLLLHICSCVHVSTVYLPS